MSLSELSIDPSLDLPRGDLVLLTDVSVEADEVMGVLRSRGFIVVDVPLSLLESRVATDEPRVVIVDVDQPGAVVIATKILERVRGPALLSIGDPLRAGEIRHLNLLDNVFERPIDLPRLVDRILDLATPGPSHVARGTTPPPMYASRPSAAPPPDSVPPLSDLPRAGDPLEMSSLIPGEENEGLGPRGVLSPDLRDVLEAAEKRVAETVDKIPSHPVPEDSDDVLAPNELLSMLDEPIDPQEDDGGTGSQELSAVPLAALSRPETSVGVSEMAHSSVFGSGHTPPPPRHATYPQRAAPTPTGPATSALASSGVPAGFPSEAWRSAENTRSITQAGMLSFLREDPPSPAIAEIGVEPPVRFQEPRALGEGRQAILSVAPPKQPKTVPPPNVSRDRTTPLDSPPLFATTMLGSSMTALPSHKAPTTEPQKASRSGGSSPSLPVVFAEYEAGRPLARAISSRSSGSVSFVTSAGTRRVLLNDGDFVTAGSEVADESLVAFLAGRGDIEREIASRLAGKLPPSGRHAGAALIAQGYLGQDELWRVLRAHAEWLIGRALTNGPGTMEIELEPPTRLRAEPSVFGGATGAEVFVELMRRNIPANIALARLGGERTRFDDGEKGNLIGECALSAEEEALVREVNGRSLVELTSDLESDLVPALLALSELDVLRTVKPVAAKPEAQKSAHDPLDDEAIRQKVKARLSVVREGDYFALLGIPRSATSYEVKRAFLELRRLFEPSRLLTASTVDLNADVELIVEVLEEAYEILRDNNRRDRYRRAIEATFAP